MRGAPQWTDHITLSESELSDHFIIDALSSVSGGAPELYHNMSSLIITCRFSTLLVEFSPLPGTPLLVGVAFGAQ